MEKIIIIGSGPAAWTAAIYAARASLSPLVIEGAVTQENQMKGTLPMGQLSQTMEVENFPGFPPADLTAFIDSAIPKSRKDLMMPHNPNDKHIQGPQLVELIRAQAVHFGTRVVSDDAAEVDFSDTRTDKNRVLKLIGSGGNVYETKTVIIATGASAKYLELDSVNRFKNKGVSACAVCDGALPRYRNKPLAVIGGGDSAVEEAEYLAKFASVVYIVHRRNQLRASKIVAKRAEDNPKIKIQWNRIPKEIIGNDTDGVTGIVLGSTAGEADVPLYVSGVFMAIGHNPNTEFLQGKVALKPNGFIERPVPFRTNTSVQGVFAAGDVADDYYRQAISAAGSGCMAALDAERYLAALE
ncbi:MAG: FAD-dependent oxidoreductase [Planctomycetaceae bacterium]|nr:FAD-dependent oxidoreductase [Planctomycetaceae bacterium]